MKIMTVLGTRPEIIRLSLVVQKLDRQVEHVLVHTGQNYARELKDLFFEELNVRQPNHYLNARGSFGEQLAVMMPAMEKLLEEERPDRLLILGDTNSGLAAILAKRRGIPVYHMEAGNRCYDDRVPEEVNRRIIDHSSDILMPYTERSRQNLVREGIEARRIYVTGNPIREVIQQHAAGIASSHIHARLGLVPRQYILVTMHRAENVDVESRLRQLAQALERLHEIHGVPVIVSTHPRTRSRMEEFGVRMGKGDIRFLEPFGFFDFIALEQAAMCVVSDSGTVQEESCILQVPSVTIRDVTERPETLECGSNMLAGVDADKVVSSVDMVLAMKGGWLPPPEYMTSNVSDVVVRIVTGYR
jgi:UDP-N-acetylglucosamine 2-epimerase (non-hydrolysing)